MPGTPQPRCRGSASGLRNLPVKVAGYTFCLKTLRASPAAAFLCAKLRRTGGTTSDAALSRSSRPWSLRIFVAQKMGIPRLPSDFTLCLIRPGGPPWCMHKTYPLRMKPGASSQKGKTNSNTTNMDYQAAATIIDRNSRVFTTLPPTRAEKRRRLFFSTQGCHVRVRSRSRRRGYIMPQSTVANWLGVVKSGEAWKPNIVEKFRRYASRAHLPSAFVRKLPHGRPYKGLLRKPATTGTRAVVEIISLKAVERHAP